MDRKIPQIVSIQRALLATGFGLGLALDIRRTRSRPTYRPRTRPRPRPFQQAAFALRPSHQAK